MAERSDASEVRTCRTCGVEDLGIFPLSVRNRTGDFIPVEEIDGQLYRLSDFGLPCCDAIPDGPYCLPHLGMAAAQLPQHLADPREARCSSCGADFDIDFLPVRIPKLPGMRLCPACYDYRRGEADRSAEGQALQRNREELFRQRLQLNRLRQQQQAAAKSAAQEKPKQNKQRLSSPRTKGWTGKLQEYDDLAARGWAPDEAARAVGQTPTKIDRWKDYQRRRTERDQGA
jgi:hypothetical protein